jgi:HemY protein
MIRALFYLAFVLMGAVLAPSLITYKGHVLMAVGDYTVETTTLALGLAFAAAFLGLLLLIWAANQVKSLLFDQWDLPQRWRKRHAHDATLKGMAAFAESNWLQAEKLLAGHAKQSDMPVFNYMAAAHAAHQQQNFSQRDRYLKQASQDPEAQNAVRVTQTRYLLDHDIKKARILVDKMKISASSSVTELKLAWFTYQAQKDYLAMLPLLDALKSHQIMTKAQYQHVKLEVDTLQLKGLKSQVKLEQYWQDLSRAAQNMPELQAAYLMQLNRFDVDAAKKYGLSLAKRKAPEVLAVLPDVLHWEQDEGVPELFMRLYKRDPQNSDLVHCIGKLCVHARLFRTAQDVLAPYVKEHDQSKTHLVLLGEVSEQLGELSYALQCYKKASLVAR